MRTEVQNKVKRKIKCKKQKRTKNKIQIKTAYERK